MIKEANEEILKESIENSGKPIFIDFHALWCGPCKMLNPLLEEVSDKYSDQFEFYKVDVDHNEKLAFDYGVKNIPFLAIIENGKISRKMVGGTSKEKLEKFILGEN